MSTYQVTSAAIELLLHGALGTVHSKLYKLTSSESRLVSDLARKLTGHLQNQIDVAPRRQIEEEAKTVCRVLVRLVKELTAPLNTYAGLNPSVRAAAFLARPTIGPLAGRFSHSLWHIAVGPMAPCPGIAAPDVPTVLLTIAGPFGVGPHAAERTQRRSQLAGRPVGLVWMARDCLKHERAPGPRPRALAEASCSC